VDLLRTEHDAGNSRGPVLWFEARWAVARVMRTRELLVATSRFAGTRRPVMRPSAHGQGGELG
jgi:hypothetical protein